MSIIIVLHSNARYSSVLKVNNLFDKLESLNQGWVMSHVVRDVKLLESPFPHGSRREQMCFGCWPLQHSSFKFYKVFMDLIRNGFNGVFKMNLVIKLRELTLLY